MHQEFHRLPISLPEHCKIAHLLFEWEAWFKSKKIKTKIVKNTNGMFVLCREGISS